MWVLKRKEDGKYIAKDFIRQISGSSYVYSLKDAKKYNNREEAVADSCVENEVPVQIDPYDYFK